jgi:hypothetical protein
MPRGGCSPEAICCHFNRDSTRGILRPNSLRRRMSPWTYHSVPTILQTIKRERDINGWKEDEGERERNRQACERQRQTDRQIHKHTEREEVKRKRTIIFVASFPARVDDTWRLIFSREVVAVCVSAEDECGCEGGKIGGRLRKEGESFC